MRNKEKNQLINIDDFSREMTSPQRQQSMSFPDAMAVCLDEDKSLVINRISLYHSFEKNSLLVNMFLQ